MQSLTVVAPFLGLFGLFVAWLIFGYVKKQPNGSALMQELEGMIHDGAMAFLRREYTVLAFFIAIVFILLGIGISLEYRHCLFDRCLVFHGSRLFGNDRRYKGKFKNG